MSLIAWLTMAVFFALAGEPEAAPAYRVEAAWSGAAYRFDQVAPAHRAEAVWSGAAYRSDRVVPDLVSLVQSDPQ